MRDYGRTTAQTEVEDLIIVTYRNPSVEYDSDSGTNQYPVKKEEYPNNLTPVFQVVPGSLCPSH